MLLNSTDLKLLALSNFILKRSEVNDDRKERSTNDYFNTSYSFSVLIRFLLNM